MTAQRLALICAILFLTAPAQAHDFAVGALTIKHPWTRATPGATPTAAGFMTIVNGGSDSDRLIDVSSALSERVEIHESNNVRARQAASDVHQAVSRISRRAAHSSDADV
jgi:copper(I)-binding protein